jgi:hypothetical protein
MSVEDNKINKNIFDEIAEQSSISNIMSMINNGFVNVFTNYTNGNGNGNGIVYLFVCL